MICPGTSGKFLTKVLSDKSKLGACAGGAGGDPSSAGIGSVVALEAGDPGESGGPKGTSFGIESYSGFSAR